MDFVWSGMNSVCTTGSARSSSNLSQPSSKASVLRVSKRFGRFNVVPRMVPICVPIEHHGHLSRVPKEREIFQVFVFLLVQLYSKFMARPFLLFSFLSLFCFSIHAQDAATSEGQNAILHHTRFYEGTPIRKFSAKNSSFQLEGIKFSNASPAIYDGVAYTGT